MCRVVTQELEPEMGAVADARRAVTSALQRWELPTLAPDAELLVSELVTNALVHARTGTSLTLAVADGMLEVGVADRSPDSVPHARTVDDAGEAAVEDWRAEGGRGLQLVELVSDEWGVSVMPEGKQVWFRIGVDQNWPHLTDCPCAGEDLERVRLQSGRYAVAAPGPWDDEH